MPSITACITLFLSSYSPLFLILALRSLSVNPGISLSFVGLAIFSVSYLFIYLSKAKTLSQMIVTAASVKTRDGEGMSYIATYLLPFLGVDYKDPINIISLLIVFIVLAFLYINSTLVYANPILSLAGYHVLEVETEQGRTYALVSKRSYVRKGHDVSVVSLSDYIVLEV